MRYRRERMDPKQIVFEITEEEDGSFVAVGVWHDIFTQGDTLEELKANIKEAVRAHFQGEDTWKFEVHLDRQLEQPLVFAP
jgi:predicted RNase H-like HicB family nuclease